MAGYNNSANSYNSAGSYGSYGSSAGGARGTGGARRAPDPEGMRVMEDLMRRSPQEVANWALDQAHELGKAGANVEAMPVFKLAGVLNSAPKEMKQALVQKTMAGFGDLPASRRVEAVRLAMQSSDIMQRADNYELQRTAMSHHAAAMQRLASLEAQQAQRNPNDLNASTGSAQADLRLDVPQDPLVENLLRVAKEARFDEMPKGELQGMAAAAQGEAVRLVQPQQLLDVVAELDPAEREQLTEALIEARVVPEEQRGVLEEAVRPGGYSDKLAAALGLAAKAQKYAWVFIALPVAEFILALVLQQLSCGTPLVAWLRLDALLALFCAVAAYFSGHVLGPVYEKLNADPVGAVQRWQTVGDGRSWKARLETAVPGVQFETYRMGGIGLAVVVVLILIGAVWAIIGVLELMATALFGCSIVTTFCCILFIGMRFGCVVGLLWGLYYIMDEIQRHRSRSPMLGSTLLPMSEDAFPQNNPRPGGPPHAQGQNPQYFQRPPMYP